MLRRPPEPPTAKTMSARAPRPRTTSRLPAGKRRRSPSAPSPADRQPGRSPRRRRRSRALPAYRQATPAPVSRRTPSALSAARPRPTTARRRRWCPAARKPGAAARTRANPSGPCPPSCRPTESPQSIGKRYTARRRYADPRPRASRLRATRGAAKPDPRRGWNSCPAISGRAARRTIPPRPVPLSVARRPPKGAACRRWRGSARDRPGCPRAS